MTGYAQQRDRLSAEIEFLRLELAAGIDAGLDTSAIHGGMETARQAVFALAMREHDFDFDAACADLDEAKARAMAIGSLGCSMHGHQELTQ